MLRFLRRFDVHWTGAHRLVETLHERLPPSVWRRPGVVLQAAIGLVGIVALIALLHSDRSLELRPEPWEVPVYVGLSLVAVVVHELAHGLVIVRHGRKVNSVGFRLHLGSPAFYVESVEALLLSRRQRMVQAAAGPWAEWLFTSTVALTIWLAPTGDLDSILHRFVLLTAFTIASNLLPFAGLDGALILADLIRRPNLALESKEAVDRLGGARRSGDGPLLAYAAANTAVSTALLATAVWFWYQLFGGVIGALALAGPLGWAGAAALVGVSFGPAVFAVVPHLRRWSPIDRVVFRLERRVRIRLTQQFAAVDPFVDLDDRLLSALAGQLEIRTAHRWSPLYEEGFAGYVAADAPVELGRDGRLDEPGVVAVAGPGVAITTRRLVGRVRVGLLPVASIDLLEVRTDVRLDCRPSEHTSGTAADPTVDPGDDAVRPPTPVTCN